MKYDKHYFIRKFEAIPDSLWCTGKFTGMNEQHCALGHCGRGIGISGDTDEARALSRLYPDSIVRINDGFHTKYQQPTPKARILAALKELPDG